MLTAAPADEVNNPSRRTAFKLALALVFLRFSMLHQLVTYEIGVNLYLLYFFAIPALIGVFTTGGIRRALRGRPAYYWLGFTVWLALGIPFSYWISASLRFYIGYIRTDLPMLFVIAGLTLTWAECRKMMYAIAAGAFVNLASARFFDSDAGGRLSLDVGTIANSNDFAGHLLLVLPFLLWLALQAKSKLLRLTAAGGLAYGVLLILKTASRGGALGLIAAVVVFLILGTARQRIALIALAPIAAALLLAVVPQSALERIRSFSTTDPGSSLDAVESSESRRYLLNQSLAYTFQHPIFGVGLHEFSEYEGTHNRVVGTHGLWHETHNVFTQVSSECGIPAFLFFVAGIVSTFRLIIRTFRAAKRRPECRDIRTAASCMIVAMAGFCMAITFLNFAYFFYLPALGGLSIAFSEAAKRETRARQSGGIVPAPWAPPTPLASQAAVRAARLRAARRWNRVA